MEKINVCTNSNIQVSDRTEKFELKLLEKDESTIQYGDTILLLESKDTYKPLVIQKGGVLQNKFGHFLHDDFIGKKIGSKMISSSKVKGEKEKKYITVFDFSSSIWDKATERLTQILFSADISMILNMLDIKSHNIIMESGTGSGCLSINIVNTLSNKGHLYTFEYNKERAEKLKTTFSNLRLSEKITITNQDVLELGFHLEESQVREVDKKRYYKSNPEGKNILDGMVDGIFIDLPSPWDAIHHVHKKLKKNGALVSFSPCIEQVEKTFESLKKFGFIHSRMFEIRQRSYNYVKTDKIKIHNFGAEISNISGVPEEFHEVLVSSSRNDMRGHTGFLTYAVKG